MLEKHVSQTELPRGVVVHIGAGLCADLDIYRKAGFERIYLLEPNADLLDELQARLDGQGQVLPVALAKNDGQATLHLLNFADLSSLRQPTGLQDLMPGVAVIEDRQVDTVCFASLLEQIGPLSSDRQNLLVIDAPGEELLIAGALAQSGYRDRFQTLVLSCGKEAYFEGDSCAGNVLPVLVGLGYQLLVNDRQQDPDWPRYFLQLDEVALENEALKAELAASKAGIEVLVAEQDAAQVIADQAAAKQSARLEDLRKTNALLESQRRDMKSLLQTRQSDLQKAQEQAMLATERKVQLEEMTKAKAQLERQHQDVQGRLEAQRKRLQEVQAKAKLAAERGVQLEALSKVKVELQGLLEVQKTKTQTQAKLVTERAGQLDAVTKAKAELESQRQELQGLLEARQQQLQEAQAKAKLAAERGVQLEALSKVKTELESQLEAQKTKTQTQAERATERAGQLDAVTKAKAELEGQLKTGQQQLQEAQAKAKLAAERGAQLEALSKVKTELEGQLEARGKELQQAQARDKVASERGHKIEALNKAKAELKEALAEARAERDSRQATHAQELQNLENTLKRDLGVALRLQALARSDQQELQQRYTLLQEEKRQQEELLVKVTQKLGSAAKHLHQLANQEPVLATVPLAETVETVEKPAKKPKKKPKKKRKTAGKSR